VKNGLENETRTKDLEAIENDQCQLFLLFYLICCRMLDFRSQQIDGVVESTNDYYVCLEQCAQKTVLLSMSFIQILSAGWARSENFVKHSFRAPRPFSSTMLRMCLHCIPQSPVGPGLGSPANNFFKLKS
jgi:hypothetical protein